MLKSFFSNYELNKLALGNGDLTNLIIWLLILVTATLTLKRYSNHALLDRKQSEQLRGIAILFVITGHLWVHVAIPEARGKIILGGDAVALFLMLSGFGLTLSTMKKPLTMKGFFLSRLKRVMIPYWLATLLILILDLALLARLPQIKDLGLTLLGINISDATRNLDYVRWYITLLLFWYVIFYMGVNKKTRTPGIIFLMVCAVAAFFTSYYIFPLRWGQIFAFPVGCVIGKYYKEIEKILSKRSTTLLGAALIMLSFVAILKFFLYPILKESLPYIIVKLLMDTEGITLAFSLIVLFYLLGEKGLFSNLFLFFGKYSYELFLLHGAFLVKYNPLFGFYPSLSIIPLFLIYLALITALAIPFHYLSNKLAG